MRRGEDEYLKWGVIYILVGGISEEDEENRIM